MMKKMMALMAMTILTACDYANRASSRAEQGERLYKEAMEDYRSGRMDAAVKGFEKLLVKDPANASARFQFACLLQDVRRDFAGAYCAYREYILQRPGSDKVKLAKDRMSICEKELAKELAVRYELAESSADPEELNAVRKELKAAESRVAAAERNLAESMKRIRMLSEEKDRLLGVVKSFGKGTESVVQNAFSKEARDLLEEDEETSVAAAPDEELAQLEKEAEEELSSESSLLPKRQEVKPPENKPKETAPVKSPLPPRPKTYVVKEGDTLYGISKCFYGSILVWKKIREANKALISTDNRLRAGDTIVLPEP